MKFNPVETSLAGRSDLKSSFLWNTAVWMLENEVRGSDKQIGRAHV